MQAFARGLLLAAWAAAAGAFLCAVYDLFRLFRLGRRPGAVPLFFSDLLFCAFVYAAFALLFFNLTHGRVRWFAFACAAAGFLLWRATFGKLLMRAAEKCLSVTKTTLAKAKRYLLRAALRAKRAAGSAAACRRDIKNARRGYGFTKSLQRRKAKYGKEKDQAQQSDNQDIVCSDIRVPVHIGDKPSGADTRSPRRARKTRRAASNAAGQHR
ncbi:MAG: spore cortex biosynthesis protein YabQ [Clostridia bacterium]|nr:spore cortex biosynthesis protein YabQ [Clostridia bacterium]